MDDLLAGSESYIEAYAAFLQSGHIPPFLEDDVYQLLQHTSQDTEESCDTEVCAFFSTYFVSVGYAFFSTYFVSVGYTYTLVYSILFTSRSRSRITETKIHNYHDH